MQNYHRLDWEYLLSDLPAVYIKGEDVRDEIAGVQRASFQGWLQYQQDRTLIETDIPAQNHAEAQKLLHDVFRKAAEDTREMDAGSTATVAIITPDHKLNVAYLGDSPVILITRDPATDIIQVENLIRPHHATDLAEQKRIKEAGGIVTGGRIRNPNDGKGLELSRSFGDVAYKGVSTEKEIVTVDLSNEIAKGIEVYICVGSDGLTEANSGFAFGQVLARAISEGKTDKLAEIFAAYAFKSGSSDNITALVTRVPQVMTKPILISVFDGHGGHQTAEAALQSFKKNLNGPSL